MSEITYTPNDEPTRMTLRTSCAKIEYYHQGSIVGFKIMYRDSEPIWDGVDWDGQQASFFGLHETEEGQARKGF